MSPAPWQRLQNQGYACGISTLIGSTTPTVRAMVFRRAIVESAISCPFESSSMPFLERTSHPPRGAGGLMSWAASKAVGPLV
jgi:hypothetical protein